MTLIVALILIYIFSIVIVRLRNNVHFDLKRQLSDFSTFMVSFNIPAYMLSKVPLTHRIGKEHFPGVQVIEDNWEVIREEALALYENGHIAVKDDLPASSFYKDGRWTSFYLKLYDHDIPSAQQLAPQTMQLIEQVPGMNIALFACLNPGKKINNHHDPFSYTLRYSLGLSTPNSDECGLVVNGDDYKWKDGDSIIFDETYLHNAYNNTDTPRIILMTDIDRPLQWAWVQKFYYSFGRFFNGLFYMDNLDSSKSGIGNKLGKGLNGYKAVLKRFKHWNKPLYTATKLLVLALVLYALATAIL